MSKQIDQNVQSLAVDVLYRLEMYHPVIDGVGVFSQEGVNGINHDILCQYHHNDDHPMIWNYFPIQIYTKICIRDSTTHPHTTSTNALWLRVHVLSTRPK